MLEKKAREAILEEIRDRPRISKQEVFDLVKLHLFIHVFLSFHKCSKWV